MLWMNDSPNVARTVLSFFDKITLSDWKKEVCVKKTVLPFYQEIEDLLGRREGPVGGQEDVDVGGLELAGVRSRQTFD